MNDDELMATTALPPMLQTFSSAHILHCDASTAGETARNRKLTRHGLSEITLNFNENEFQSAFRMSNQAFYRVVNKISPYLFTDNDMARRSSFCAIDVDVQFARFVRVLAGAAYLGVILTFGVARQTVHLCVEKVHAAVLCTLSIPGLTKPNNDAR